ncbi:MAG TPA: hypothetical protein VHV57_03820 [Acidimicrobiales bacterium]|jgi:pyruvate,orthophosphate dikinase|nr:hypothetical protein [Acidimicrobiales bacterium]
MKELSILQAARMKGRLSPEDAAASSGLALAEVGVQLAELEASGMVTLVGSTYRLTPEGRLRLEGLISDEQGSVDATELRGCYEDFDTFNTDLKAIITSWQIKGDGTANDHTDASYDAMIIERILKLDRAFTVLLSRMILVSPRLTPYVTRFGRAVNAMEEGDHSYVARPILDSYHTVWFELHEELIGLLGLTRAEEAIAGRAG